MRTLVILILGTMLGFSTHAAVEYQPDVLIVKTKPTMNTWGATDPSAPASLKDKIKSVRPSFGENRSWGRSAGFPADQYFTVRLKPGVSLEATMAELKTLEGVESVQPDYILTDPDLELPKDPKVSSQWYLEQLKVPEAWEITQGQNTLVADVESGFDTEHPDLKNQFNLEKTFDYDPKTDNTAKVNDNKMSHGTPVCGLIAAEANNDLFGVGIAHGAKLIGSQMANSWEAHSTETLWTVTAAKAILGSVEKGASVVLVEKQVPSTLASIESVKVLYDAVKAAVDAGVPVIVPAGNFTNELTTEAAQEDSGSIFVGATTQDKKMASFSNFGSRVNVSAPGESVYSVQEGNSETADFGGTSSASAITAGVTALIRAANPKLKPRDIRTLLVETGLPLETSDEDPLLLMGSFLSSMKDELPKVGPLIQAGPAVRRALQN